MKTNEKTNITEEILSQYTIDLSEGYSKALQSYCSVANRTPEEVILDAIIKELIDMYVQFRKEEQGDLDNGKGLVKTEDCLKDFFQFIEFGIISSK